MKLFGISFLPSKIGTGAHVQVIQGWRGIAHQGHEEEWDLQHVFGNEVQALEHPVVPCDSIKAEDEGQEPNQYLDTKDLQGYVSDCFAMYNKGVLTGMEMASRIAMPAATAMAACL